MKLSDLFGLPGVEISVKDKSELVSLAGNPKHSSRSHISFVLGDCLVLLRPVKVAMRENPTQNPPVYELATLRTTVPRSRQSGAPEAPHWMALGHSPSELLKNLEMTNHIKSPYVKPPYLKHFHVPNASGLSQTGSPDPKARGAGTRQRCLVSGAETARKEILSWGRAMRTSRRVVGTTNSFYRYHLHCCAHWK